jgi:WG containing repeat
MRILPVLCVLLTFNTTLFAQFDSFEIKGKKGIQFNEIKISNPKFDRIEFKDDSIATAYKGSKVYFINVFGKTVYKSKADRAESFIDGFSIISKKEKFGAINRDGEKVIPLKSLVKPYHIGKMMAVESPNSFYYKHFDLYGQSGLLEKEVDSIKLLLNWVIAYDTWSESYTYTKKRFLRKDKEMPGIIEHPSLHIYEAQNASLITRRAQELHLEGDFLIVKKENNHLAIFSSEKGEVISGNYKHFIFNSQTIYALKDTVKVFDNLSIFDLSGKIIKNDLGFLSPIDDDRFLFTKDSMQFIGDELGNQLSPLVTGFGELSEGYRIVYLNERYSYMNDKTYEIQNFSYPILAKTVTTTHSSYNLFGHIRSKFKNLGTRIGNFGRSFIGKRRKSLETYTWSSYYEKNTVFKEGGHSFVNGFAIVCTYKVNDTNLTRLPLIVQDREPFTYNFINHSGEQLNETFYKQVFDFKNGMAWVRNRSWTLLDTLGKEQKDFSYSDMVPLENGYFFVATGFSEWGVMDPNFQIVVPFKHARLVMEGSNVFEWSDKETIIYEMPDSE